MSSALGDARVPTIRIPPPGPKSRQLLSRHQRVLYKGLIASQSGAPFVTARKWGHAIEDVDGNVYLNLAIASGSQPLGPDYPGVLEPTIEALRRFGNEDCHHVCTEPMAALAERLVEIAPGGITRVDIALNGTEAVESAMKFMRRATGRPIILGFMGQYHGETTATVGVGAQMAEVGRGQRQLNPGYVHVPYPHPYRSPFSAARPGGSGDSTVDFIRDHVLFHLVHPEDVAGVMIEPVAGAGGVLIPPDSFWPALVDLCREHDWLLCADEVKSGMGRTGKMFAVEHWGVEPDLIVLGKALGGGVMPMGAVLGTERALGSFGDVSSGSTWSWPPAGCVAGLHAIDAYQQLLPRVGEIERVARATIGTLPARYQVVGDVRICGTYLAIEFVRDGVSKEPVPRFQRVFEEEVLKRGVVAQSGENTYKMLPPYIVPLDDFRRGMSLVEEAIVAALEAGALEGPE